MNFLSQIKFLQYVFYFRSISSFGSPMIRSIGNVRKGDIKEMKR
ncbi:hypothetical protein MUS_1972 [Bacillus velezensis YAU B9601-Y2]|uniref:Uncharacterized protein n=1 Tax=Bacillus amyloliquefaciens (strain Y2) TaxID=1155777 RepID=I2C5L7_BACAY|nr:hypothetical protein MUS_1972 [Bacillus velezensis YAU B9601-Y2]RUS04415.1 hypothetical protein EFW58_03325 [Bacillus velezensis]